MATRATLFLPGGTEKDRIAVDVGSQEARDLFAKGFKLETPFQNLQTYKPEATKEISVGEGNRLYAIDKTAGTQTYIPNQRALEDLVVSQGFQDVRSPLSAYSSFAPGTLPGSQTTATTTATVTPPATGTTTIPTAAGGKVTDFNAAIANLLSGIGTNQTDEDLQRQRNELIQARFESNRQYTPLEERNLTPEQQETLRRQRESGIETSLTGVTSAIQSREKQRAAYKEELNSALDVIKEQAALAKDNLAAQNAARDDGRAQLKFMFDTFGTEPFKSMTTAEKREWEKISGLPTGTLDHVPESTLKEESQALAREKLEQSGAKFFAGNDYLRPGMWNAATQQYYVFNPDGTLSYQGIVADPNNPTRNGPIKTSPSSGFNDWVAKTGTGTVIQGYDVPVSYFNDGRKIHSAIDIPGKLNDPVYSPVAGKITEAASSSGWGTSVVIQDASGNKWRLAHFNSLGGFNVGDNIQSGQYLGGMGNTGYVLKGDGGTVTAEERAAGRGTHIHMEVKDSSGKLMNPATLMGETNNGIFNLSGGASESTALAKMIDEIGSSGKLGSDGFLSPDDYLAYRNKWIQNGYSATTFDTKMVGYKNPNNQNYVTTKQPVREM